MRGNSLLENERVLRDATICGGNLFNKENTLNECVKFDGQKRRITTGSLPTIEFNNECIEIGAQFIRPKRRVTTGPTLPAVEINAGFASFMEDEKQEERKSGKK